MPGQSGVADASLFEARCLRSGDFAERAGLDLSAFFSGFHIVTIAKSMS